MVGAALAYSIAGSGNRALTSGLNGFAWAGVVLSSFPRAMLMASRFDFERAVCGRRGSYRARLAGRHHVGERRILGTRWRLFAVHLARHRSRMGSGRELGPVEPQPCDACGRRCWPATPSLVLPPPREGESHGKPVMPQCPCVPARARRVHVAKSPARSMIVTRVTGSKCGATIGDVPWADSPTKSRPSAMAEFDIMPDGHG